MLPAIGPLNWAVMAATIGVNVFVSWYEAREGRRLKSAFLVADSAHTRADLYVSLGVVASFVAAKLGFAWADPARGSRDRRHHRLAGGAHPARRLQRAHRPRADRGRASSSAWRLAVPGVLQVHDVRTRGRGDAVYVDLTVHLDGAMSLAAAHEVADRIEAALHGRAPRDRGRRRPPRAGRARSGVPRHPRV